MMRTLALVTVMSQLSFVSAQEPAVRDLLSWPFADTSIWNMPIHEGAVYVHAQLEYAQGAMNGSPTEDEEIIIMTPDAPLVPVHANTVGWDWSRNRCDPAEQGDIMFEVPIPSSFANPHTGGTPNASAGILLPDGVTILQTQPFHRCSPGGLATSQYRFSDLDITGEGVRGSHGGSGLSAVGGSIRVGELVRGGVIRHATKMNLYAGRHIAFTDDGTPGYRWPADRADGYASSSTYRGSVPQLEMGALLALKPDFDMSALQTEPARILADAYVKYGVYVVDDCAWDVYGIEIAWEPHGRVREQFEEEFGFSFVSGHPVRTETPANDVWMSDMCHIIRSLHVVDNNAPATIGGGPNDDRLNRLAPMAPPIDAVGLRGKTSPVRAGAAKGSASVPAGGSMLAVDILGRRVRVAQGSGPGAPGTARGRHAAARHAFAGLFIVYDGSGRRVVRMP